MTDRNEYSVIDTQNEQVIDWLRNEIASLRFQLTKKNDRITSLDVMLNRIMKSHTAQVRAYEGLEGKLEDVIEMLRKGVPHLHILDYL